MRYAPSVDRLPIESAVALVGTSWVIFTKSSPATDDDIEPESESDRYEPSVNVSDAEPEVVLAIQVSTGCQRFVPWHHGVQVPTPKMAGACNPLRFTT